MYITQVLTENINEIVLTRIKNWFKKNKIKTAIINISGGADSTYVAYALVKALGKENVIGLLQPNGDQKDISDSWKVIENLSIKHFVFDISEAFDTLVNSFKGFTSTLTADDYKKFKGDYNFENAVVNLAPRLRMANAYMVANAVNGVVVGTGNASERYIGFFTKFGDGASDFNPISDICKTDLIQAGIDMGIPEKLMKKVPADGLTGKTDEEKYGFTYHVLDSYIKTGKCDNNRIKNKIDKMNFNAQHKL